MRDVSVFIRVRSIPSQGLRKTAAAAEVSSSLESTVEMVAETALVEVLVVALDFLAARASVMVRVL